MASSYFICYSRHSHVVCLMLPFPVPAFLLISTFIIALLPRSLALIDCRNCQPSICYGNCKGDACYYIESFYGDMNIKFRRYGCLNGVPLELGCQINQDGQKLCICNDAAFCNTNVLPNATRLPDTACQVTGRAPANIWTNPCAASFCISSSIQQLPSSSSASYTGCAGPTDFSVVNTNSLFFYPPGGCVTEEVCGRRTTTCYTNTSATEPPTPLNPVMAVTCHVDAVLMPISRQSTCSGDLCALSLYPNGVVHRGCLSIGESASAVKIGFFQDYNNRMQWICDGDFCNYDLQSVFSSWQNSSDLSAYESLADANTQAVISRSVYYSNCPLTGLRPLAPAF